MPLHNSRTRPSPILVPARPAPKATFPKPPTRTELVNAKKAFAGHTQMVKDYEVKVKDHTKLAQEATDLKDPKKAAEHTKLAESAATMGQTHKDAAADARKIISRGPKVS